MHKWSVTVRSQNHHISSVKTNRKNGYRAHAARARRRAWLGTLGTVGFPSGRYRSIALTNRSCPDESWTSERRGVLPTRSSSPPLALVRWRPRSVLRPLRETGTARGPEIGFLKRGAAACTPVATQHGGKIFLLPPRSSCAVLHFHSSAAQSLRRA